MNTRSLLILAACFLRFGTAAAQTVPMPDMPGMAAPAAPRSASDQAMMAGMTRMQQAMGSAPMTGDPDRDFVAMMLPHHAGAIDMAKVELRYGHDPVLRRLAQDIVAAQAREVRDMRAWQARHPAP